MQPGPWHPEEESVRSKPQPLRFAIPLMLVLAVSQPAAAVRVCTYNALNWPDDYATRAPYFRTVMAEIDADVIVLQEVDSVLGVNKFYLDVLEQIAPGEYWMMPFANGPDTDNACFYKTAVLDSIFCEQIYTPVRWTSVYRFRLDGYDSAEAEFSLLSTHLKAGTDATDAADRLAMTTEIRNYLNEYPANSNFMVAGDFNLQSSAEGSYQMLVGYLADNDGRSKDPINTGGTWHDNYTLRFTHTQATQGEWGGMDDRFDFVLVSYALDDGDGLSYVSGSYTPLGNDGLRFNNPINDPPNQIVSQDVADALNAASDHTAVYLDLQIPARVSASASLELGAAIVGAAAPTETLAVSNAASAPAEDLEYSLTAPSGFTAPVGPFSAGPGVEQNHVVTMETDSSGLKSGDLEIDSNDLDDPTLYVALSGTVLDHASPSLSDSGVLLEDTLDLGSSAPGTHGGAPLRVYNDGYGSLQALMEIYDAEIVGGDGRFAFVGGFDTKTAGSSPAEYEIEFDSGTAEWDSLYTATLTLSTRDDQTVSGATDLDDLVVHLEAYVGTGTSVSENQVLALALAPAMPNPFRAGTALMLSMPEPGRALVEVYDVAGRRVRTLEQGVLTAGEHTLRWDGRDERGAPVASGVYLCRAQVGDWRESRKLVLLR